MKPVLVVYATRHGSTEVVAAAIAARMRNAGLEVDVRRAEDVDELPDCSGVLLGAPIYMGRWHGDARAFLDRHHELLTQLPVAAFALGPRSLEPAEVAQSKAQLRAALDRFPSLHIHPTAVFGGVIDPSTLPFPFSRLHASDARDWDAIDTFGDECARIYDYGKPADASRDHRSALQHAPR